MSYDDDTRKAFSMVQRVFNSTDGAGVLEFLRFAFDGDAMLDDDPQRTAFNLGRRDVVRYIDSIMEQDLND